MQAIFSKVKELHPSMTVLYVTSEEFVNDFVAYIRFNREGDYRKSERFKTKYRTVDMLLVDDIQFIAENKVPRRNSLTHLMCSSKPANQLVLTSAPSSPGNSNLGKAASVPALRTASSVTFSRRTTKPALPFCRKKPRR